MMSRLDLKSVVVGVGPCSYGMPAVFFDDLVHVKSSTGDGITGSSSVCNGCADDEVF